MKAVRIKRFGGPETVSLEEIPRPEPGKDEVLVKVHATSVNPIDWKFREGLFRDLRLPFTPGGDFSGVIEETGAGVKEYKKGQEVYGCIPGSTGADAEYLIAPISAIAPKPSSLDHVQAACVPLASMTAYQALFDHGKLKQGQTVLILGASGGVGSFAVQLAKKAGARVLGTASSENLRRVTELGADEAIDYKKHRIEDAAKNVDLCVDLVGGDLQKRAFESVRKGGRLISTVQPPDATRASSKGVEAKMFSMRPQAEQLREIGKRIDAGEIRVKVSKVMRLEEAGEAEEMNRRHEVGGKIALRVEK